MPENGCTNVKPDTDAGYVAVTRLSVIEVGEYEGVVRISRRVFQILLPETPTPESCRDAYHLHRIRLELITERKVRRRQLTDDGNVEITGRDLPERAALPTARRVGHHRAAS